MKFTELDHRCVFSLCPALRLLLEGFGFNGDGVFARRCQPFPSSAQPWCFFFYNSTFILFISNKSPVVPGGKVQTRHFLCCVRAFFYRKGLHKASEAFPNRAQLSTLWLKKKKTQLFQSLLMLCVPSLIPPACQERHTLEREFASDEATELSQRLLSLSLGSRFIFLLRHGKREATHLNVIHPPKHLWPII